MKSICGGSCTAGEGEQRTAWSFSWRPAKRGPDEKRGAPTRAPKEVGQKKKGFCPWKKAFSLRRRRSRRRKSRRGGNCSFRETFLGEGRMWEAACARKAGSWRDRVRFSQKTTTRKKGTSFWEYRTSVSTKKGKNRAKGRPPKTYPKRPSAPPREKKWREKKAGPRGRGGTTSHTTGGTCGLRGKRHKGKRSGERTSGEQKKNTVR